MMDEQILSGDANYRTELEKNGALAFVPSGNSMWPTLKNRGQSVIVERKTKKLARFDVALYLRPSGTYVLHRVIEPTDFGYVICGDSQFMQERVSEEQVFGVMTGFYKGKNFVSCSDKKYIASVEKWYGHPKKRKLRLKIFYFGIRVKGKIKRALSLIFGKTERNSDNAENERAKASASNSANSAAKNPTNDSANGADKS